LYRKYLRLSEIVEARKLKFSCFFGFYNHDKNGFNEKKIAKNFDDRKIVTIFDKIFIVNYE